MSFFRDSDAHASVDALTRRVTAMEALIEALATQAGLGPQAVRDLRDQADPGLTDEVRRLADAGKIIPAIKEYRTATGAGLRDAKNAVEEYAQRGRSW